MNLIKSLFISGFSLFCLAALIFTGWNALQNGFSLGTLGVALSVAPWFLTIGWWLLTQSVVRTKQRLYLFHALALAGVCLSVYATLSERVGAWSPVLSLVGLLGVLAYDFWYSKLSRRPNRHLQIGERLPFFKLKNARGETVAAHDFFDKPAILMFYRGNWCPLCMAQIKEIAAMYREIENLGAKVALISNQPAKNTAELARKFNVNFEFLTDENNAFARELGIDSQNGMPMGMQTLGYESETVLPTVIITDANGIVIWTHETDNYRVRPEPETFLQVLREKKVFEQNV